jgi:hypothetical protein
MTERVDDHDIEQLRRMAAAPLPQRLQWLEEMLRMAERMQTNPGGVERPAWALVAGDRDAQQGGREPS